MPEPITDRDQHAEGLTRNTIGRQIGRAASTVSKIAAELGLDFDRSRTAARHVRRTGSHCTASTPAQQRSVCCGPACTGHAAGPPLG